MPINPGAVHAFEPGDPPPPTSTLADAFFAKDALLADAIVLRGYLGRSPILQRALQYLESAQEAAVATERGGAEHSEAPDPSVADAAWRAANDEDGAWTASTIDYLINLVQGVTELAKPHIPWRIYLTPSLDKYVDFHLTSLLAWRQEPKTERQDTYTVWLRAFSPDGKPFPYRVVSEAMIGPTFSAYLGGDLVDDFLGEAGSSSGAWGDQIHGGGKPWSGVRCGGKPWSGVRCAG